MQKPPKNPNHVNHKNVFPSSLLLEASHFSVIKPNSMLRNASSALHLNALMLKVFFFFQRHKEYDFPHVTSSWAWVLHRISSLIFLITFLFSILSAELHGNKGSHRLLQIVREFMSPLLLEVLKIQPPSASWSANIFSEQWHKLEGLQNSLQTKITYEFS